MEAFATAFAVVILKGTASVHLVAIHAAVLPHSIPSNLHPLPSTHLIPHHQIPLHHRKDDEEESGFCKEQCDLLENHDCDHRTEELLKK